MSRPVSLRSLKNCTGTSLENSLDRDSLIWIGENVVASSRGSLPFPTITIWLFCLALIYRRDNRKAAKPLENKLSKKDTGALV